MKISNYLRNGSFVFVVLALTACCAGPSTGRISEETESGVDTEEERKPSGSRDDFSPKPDELYSADLVAAGRALEAGEVDKAAGLLKGAGQSPEALLLLARTAAAKGDFEEAIRRYHDLTDKRPDFEEQRIAELSEALAKAGRTEEAAAALENLLTVSKGLSKSERARLMEKRALWLLDSEKTAEAIKAFEDAIKLAVGDRTRDKLEMKLAKSYAELKDKAKAVSILLPLAEKASRASIMEDAINELKALKAAPSWSADERLARTRTLISLRAWDAAISTLKPLLNRASKSAVSQEARYLEARIFFKRRRHYKEALKLFGEISKEGGAHAEEAEFMIARALSRLDRDKEAIKRYTAFAKKTKRPAKAAEARFLAGRLEFYLGNHRAALRSFESLVGNGKKKLSKCRLSGDEQREAHFLAGMSAFLLKLPARARPHFEAGTIGTNSAEVVARNSYWTAAALVQTNKKAGIKALKEICSDDPTSWYAVLAARRVESLEGDATECALASPSFEENSDNAQPLEALSPLAAFLARAGFFKEAALALREAEKSGSVKASMRDWIANYIALDAPRFSIRRASAGLKWPPDDDEWWRARAAYPAPYEDLVRQVEKEHGLPSELIWAVARKESLFDPDALSRVGAMGMMQMMPQTYEKNRKRAGLPPLKKGELPGSEKSILAAGFEFENLSQRFGGSLPLIIMAYNAGPGAVSRWLDRSGGLPIDVFVEKAGFAQTRNYVRRVFKNLVRYRMLASKPVPTLPEKAEVPKKPAIEDDAPGNELDAGEIDD